MTNLCLVVQEEKLKRSLSHMQAWKIAHTRKDPKPGEPKYYGKKTAHRKKAYSDGYLALHPDTPDPLRRIWTKGWWSAWGRRSTVGRRFSML